MKKSLFTICFITYSITAFAQSHRDSTITVGIKGGLNFASLLQKSQNSSSSISSGTSTSFHAGIFVNFRLGDLISLQPSLLYIGKGATDKENISSLGFSENSNTTLTLNYLELPVYALYHRSVGNGDFFAGAGPFVGFGISGKEKGSSTMTFEEPAYGNEATTVTRTSIIDNKVNYGSSDSSDIKRLDYGFSAMAGFRFKDGFLISVFYDLGLNNISPANDADIKTRVFGISVGYSF